MAKDKKISVEIGKGLRYPDEERVLVAIFDDPPTLQIALVEALDGLSF